MRNVITTNPKFWAKLFQQQSTIRALVYKMQSKNIHAIFPTACFWKCVTNQFLRILRFPAEKNSIREEFKLHFNCTERFIEKIEFQFGPFYGLENSLKKTSVMTFLTWPQSASWKQPFVIIWHAGMRHRKQQCKSEPSNRTKSSLRDWIVAVQLSRPNMQHNKVFTCSTTGRSAFVATNKHGTPDSTFWNTRNLIETPFPYHGRQ